MQFDSSQSKQVARYLYKTEPRQHQGWSTSIFLSQGMTSALWDSDPGTGKTKTGIDIAVNLFAAGEIEKCVIFAPAGVHIQWCEDEIPKHCSADYACFSYEAQTWKRKYTTDLIKDWRESTGLQFVSFNYETLPLDSGRKRIQQLLAPTSGDKIMLIFDESHRLKNPQAESTKMAMKIASHCKYKIAMTGTPTDGKPFAFWSQYEILCPGLWGLNYFLFQHRYGLFVKRKGNGRQFRALIEDRDRKFIKKLYDQGKNPAQISAITGITSDVVQHIVDNPEYASPYRNLEELKQKISPLTFTIRKDECLDLPEKTFQPILCEFSAEQKKVYQELKKRYMAEYEGKELTLNNKLTLTLRLQQITGGFYPSDDTGEGAELTAFKKNPKLDAVIEYLKDEPDLEKIIIAAVFNAEVDAILDRIKKEFPHVRAEKYNGKVSSSEKTRVRKEYQDPNGIDILVGHPKSIGTGLNLQNGYRMYIYSSGYSFIERTQLEDRIHRDGMTGTAIYHDIYIRGSVDETIKSVLIDRKDVAEFFKGTKSLSQIV